MVRSFLYFVHGSKMGHTPEYLYVFHSPIKDPVPQLITFCLINKPYCLKETNIVSNNNMTEFNNFCK